MRLFRRKKKEYRVCPNCKNPVPEGLAFCDSCGFRVIPPPACRKCQAPLAPDTNFCENCGTPAGAAPEAQPETIPDEQPGTEEEKERSPEFLELEIPEPEPGAVPEAQPEPSPTELPLAGEERSPGMLDPEKPEPKPYALSEMQPETSPAEVPITEEERSPDIPDPEIPKPDAAPEVLWPVIAPPPGTSLPAEKPVPASNPAPVPARIVQLPKRTLILAGAGFVCLIVALAVLFWGAGCGNGLVPPCPSPAAAPAPATMTQGGAIVTEPPGGTEAVIAGPPLVSGPVQVPPESLRIWLQADRDPITHIVTVIYNGGKGERAVRDVSVRLTRSDGTVLQETFRPLITGEGVAMQGTKYADRLEVIVTYNSGEAMTVIDKIFPYHERN